MKNLKFLKSPWFLVVAFLLSAGGNLPHLVDAYQKTAMHVLPGILENWYPWLIFIVFDLSILILAINKRDEFAIPFALIIFGLNCFVMWYDSPVPTENVTYWWWIYYWPGLALSALFAFCVYWFSFKISEYVFDAETEEINKETAKKAAEASRNELEATKKRLENQEKELEHLRKVAEYAGRSNESLLKTAANRKKQISSNGISKEDKQRMQEEIKAMLKAAGK